MRRPLLVLILSALLACAIVPPAVADTPAIDEFVLPDGGAVIDGMALDRAGNVWLIDSAKLRMYKFDAATREFNHHSLNDFVGAMFTGISVDSSGRVWFADHEGNRIGYLKENFVGNESFVQKYEFPVSIMPYDVIYALGDIYIGGKEELGQLDIDTLFMTDKWVKNRHSALVDIAPGHDGNVWFVERDVNRIGVYYPLYDYVEEFDIPTADSKPSCLAIDNTDRIWFIESGANKLGTLDMKTKAFTETDMPVIDGKKAIANRIAVDGSGNVWISDTVNDRILKYADGKFTHVKLALKSYPTFIEADGKGNVWYMAGGKATLGKISAGAPLPSPSPSPSPTAAAPSPTEKPSGGPVCFSVLVALGGVGIVVIKRFK